MKNYFIRADLGEETPSYDFVVKAKGLDEAVRIAKIELKSSYTDQWNWNEPDGIDFTCQTITAKGLLDRLTIN